VSGKKLALMLVCAVLFLIGWSHIRSFLVVPGPVATNDALPRPGRRFIIKGMDFLQVDSAGNTLAMTATRVEKGAGSLMHLDAVRGKRSGRNGATAIRADTGTYDESEGILTLNGGVTMRTPDGFIAASDRVIYDRKKEILASPVPVEISGDKGRISGDRLKYRPADGVMTVKGRVRCLIESGVI